MSRVDALVQQREDLKARFTVKAPQGAQPEGGAARPSVATFGAVKPSPVE